MSVVTFQPFTAARPVAVRPQRLQASALPAFVGMRQQQLQQPAVLSCAGKRECELIACLSHSLSHNRGSCAPLDET